jgi:hypothetical protein
MTAFWYCLVKKLNGKESWKHLILCRLNEETFVRLRTQTSRRKNGDGTRVPSLVTAICLVLLALLTVASFAHLHPNEQDADHCPLCVVLHTAVPVAASAAMVVLVKVGRQTAVFEPAFQPTRRITRSFIRPPPSHLWYR